MSYDPSTEFALRCRIREIAAERGFSSIRALDDELRKYGVGANVIDRLDRGVTTRVDFATLVRLQIALGVSLDSLFELTTHEELEKRRNTDLRRLPEYGTIRLNGERVVQALEARGAERKDLAKALGVDPSLVTRYLNGERLVTPEVFASIAEFVGVEEDELKAKGGNMYG